jgi:hypothetical protein
MNSTAKALMSFFRQFGTFKGDCRQRRHSLWGEVGEIW